MGVILMATFGTRSPIKKFLNYLTSVSSLCFVDYNLLDSHSEKELAMIILKNKPTGLFKEETVVVVDKDGL